MSPFRGASEHVSRGAEACIGERVVAGSRPSLGVGACHATRRSERRSADAIISSPHIRHPPWTSSYVGERPLRRRILLAGAHMLNVFTLANGRLFQEEIESHAALANVQPVWVDLDAPTDEEKGWIVEHFGLTIPSDAVDDDLEESARFYEEDNGELHIRSDFLIDDGETPRNVRVAFILFRNVLFSVHAEELPVFRLLRLRARRIPALIGDAKDVLLKLYDADAEYSADALEGIYDHLEAVSARVLRQDVNDQVAGEALSAIAREEDLNGRVRRNVMDTRRAVSFMMRSRMLNAEQFEEARQILRDIDSLDSHSTFIFDKINFLMNATVGFININQNKIIKIFSVASVAFLPPTLIASIYGMNFKILPELNWDLGYPFALLLMVASAITPFWYFRRRGWLR